MKDLPIILAIVIFYNLSCTFHNPLNYQSDSAGNHNLSIKTDKNLYTWSQNESNFSVVIEGTLTNQSDETYYSRIGDLFGGTEQTQLFIAGNSAGCIEKYNCSDNSWHEVNLAGFLIEGSKFVPLKPSKLYTISAYLTTTDAEEKGTYRIRIDYYDNQEPGDADSLFQDYSNTFNIR